MISSLLGGFPDIAIAVVLIVIAAFAVLISKMGVLPKKSLPFIIGGLAGIFGIAMFRRSREKSLRDDLKRREQALTDLTQRMKTTETSVDAADQQRTAALADLQRQQDAAQKELLLIRARTVAEKDEISKLQGDALFQRFDDTFGGK
jgi:hypothetical protein